MRILLIINQQWWERKCPPFWPDQFECLASHPGVTLQISGPHWPDYAMHRTLKENVDAIMPDAEVVYLWRPLGIAEFEGVRSPEQPLKQLKVSAYQDDPRRGCVEAKKVGLDLLFYHDLWDSRFFEGSGVRSVYLPLGVNLSLFGGWETPQSRRRTQALLTGNQSTHTYPLRAKFHSVITQRQVPGRIRSPSPYRMRSLTDVRREQKAYAADLCNARVSLVSTCPHIPLTLRKYFESLAAGCVLVGDMPHSPPDDVRGCINEVSRSMSLSEISGRIRRLLADPDECERQRVRNRKVAEAYSYERFAERWVSAVNESLKS